MDDFKVMKECLEEIKLLKRLYRNEIEEKEYFISVGASNQYIVYNEGMLERIKEIEKKMECPQLADL